MAQNQSEKYIQGAILQSGGTPNVKNNVPIQYADRQKQYIARRTRQFSDVRAKYSSDYVQAKVQGIAKDDFYRYFTTNVRFSNLHSSPTTTQQTDDIKNVLFAEEKIEYFPIGAKIETMGSTWICTNPSNISNAQVTAVVRRCNTSYNLYDYYGNILTEPIILEKITMMGNDNDKPQNLVMMEGYFNVICQLNDNTKKLGLNQRIILGSKAYHITGFNDFYQEFSCNYDSTHILYYTVRIEEPNENDDVANHIANGNTFSFTAQILEGARELNVGNTLKLYAVFIRKIANEIAINEEMPTTWIWESADEDIATVDENGVVTATGLGTTQIRATLVQNPNVVATTEIFVTEEVQEPYLAFVGIIPKTIEQFNSALLTAKYFENGVATTKPIKWTFSGAGAEKYYTRIDNTDNQILDVTADVNVATGQLEISYPDNYKGTKFTLVGSDNEVLCAITPCWMSKPTFEFPAENSEETESGILSVYINETDTIRIYAVKPSKEPLVVTATYGDKSVSTEIMLIGY